MPMIIALPLTLAVIALIVAVSWIPSAAVFLGWPVEINPEVIRAHDLKQWSLVWGISSFFILMIAVLRGTPGRTYSTHAEMVDAEAEREEEERRHNDQLDASFTPGTLEFNRTGHFD